MIDLYSGKVVGGIERSGLTGLSQNAEPRQP